MCTVNRLPPAHPVSPSGEEGDAVVDAALHLVGVADGVDGPHVVGVGGDRRPAGSSACGVVAGLLEAEGRHASHERSVRVQRVEPRGAAADDRGEPAASPVKKSSWWPSECQESVGHWNEQIVEAAGRTAPVARRPGADGAPRATAPDRWRCAAARAAAHSPAATRSATSVLIRFR